MAIFGLANLSKHPPSFRRPLIRLALLISAFLLFGALTFATLVNLLYWRPGLLDYYAHRGTYQGLVDAAKQWPLKAGQTERIRVNLRSDPAGLSKAPEIPGPETEGAQTVYLEKTLEGAYRIVFGTADHGHIGFGGYIFQDSALGTPRDVPWEADCDVQRINENWFSYYCTSV